MPSRIMVLAALVSAQALAEGGTVTGFVDAIPHKYIEETIAYLKDAPKARPKRRHHVGQKGMTFLPRLLAITAGDSVTFSNDDSVHHNVFSPDGEGYDLGLFGKGESRERTFGKPGVYSQQCRMHPEMQAYVFVGSNPYAAVVGSDGTFVIHDVPPGTWKVSIWNPYLTAPDQAVTVGKGGSANVRFEIKR